MLAQLKADYPDDVRVAYRHFPLMQSHDKAALATQASEAAGKQDMFWEMHDALYLRQSEWESLSVNDFQDWVTERAGELGLDVDQFADDLVSQESIDLAQAAFDQGVQAGIPGTPFVLINDNYYNGPMDYFNLSTIVKLLALQKQQYSECPPMVIDASKIYIATLEMKMGNIVVELLPDKAPLAVNNFVFLAREGWYDGVTFHRVLETLGGASAGGEAAGGIAQAGDPTGTGFGGPGYTFINESSDLTFDGPGWLAMGNAGPDTNSSQFFLTTGGPIPHLDGGYTIFGRVIEGQEVVDGITLRDPSQNAQLPPGDEIIRVTIEEK